VARHDPHTVAVGEQFSDEPPTDVAGRSRHEAERWKPAGTSSKGKVRCDFTGHNSIVERAVSSQGAYVEHCP
jgi:hypothetical protein